MILTIIGCCVIFSMGFLTGAYLRSIVYDNKDWQVMRWDSNILGYRPLRFGAMLHKNDNIIMAVHLDSDSFPEDGMRYEWDD